MKKKKINIVYWILTALMSILILLGAIIDIMKSEEAVAFIRHLGYPEYFVRFIGILKVAGILAIILPFPNRLKEWAYAGLVFDITGAIYSHISSGDCLAVWLPAVVALLIVCGSYLLFVYKTNINFEKLTN